MDAYGLAWFVSALGFAVSTSGSPGPNNTMLAASGASWGFRSTLPHMLGITVGFPLMVMVMALGAGEVLRARPWLHDALRWVAAAYLLWLAWRLASARPSGADGTAAGQPLGFLGAAAFQWVNPKAWIIALGAAVTYTGAGGAAPATQALAIAGIFGAVSMATTAFWTLIGVGAARLLRTPRALRGFNFAMAGLLVASLLPMLWGE